MLAALLLAVAAPMAAPSPSAPMPAPSAPPEPRPIRTADMVANLYLPARGGKVPAILLLGGSEGGLGKGVARQAALLAGRGYAVLQLSYFAGPGQPAILKLIPIETFTRVIDWLKKQPEVAGDRIGIIGTSKGAEAALLVASRRPDLKIIVLGVPSSVVWPGIDGDTMVAASSWTEQGQPLPYLPFGWSGEWRGIYALYAGGLADTAKATAAAIPAERAGGAIVMVCGEADGLWPSCPMARAVTARLKDRHYPHPVTLLAYPDAGHAAFGPPVDPLAPGAATIGVLGGTVAGNLAARADGWPRVLAALDAALQPGTGR